MMEESRRRDAGHLFDATMMDAVAALVAKDLEYQGLAVIDTFLSRTTTNNTSPSSGGGGVAERVRSEVLNFAAWENKSSSQANPPTSEVEAAAATVHEASSSLHSVGKFTRGEVAGSEGFWTTRYDPSRRTDYIYWISEEELGGGRRGAADGSGSPLASTNALFTYFLCAHALSQRLLRYSSSGNLKENEQPVVMNEMTAHNDDASSSSSSPSQHPVPPPPIIDLNGATSLDCDRMMLSLYPTTVPSYFRMHVDNPNHYGRILTFVYYVNSNWQGDRDGGELRAIVSRRCGDTQERKLTEVRVDPVLDRLVVFYADHRVPHEVRPTVSPSPSGNAFRCSVTLWFSHLSEAEKKEAYQGAFTRWMKHSTSSQS